MSSKNTYWLMDPSDGSFALVEGADERDRWVKGLGWSEAESEPGATDQVHLRNSEHPELGPAKLPRAAAEDPAWAARGWSPGAPPEPTNAAIAHWPRLQQTSAGPADEAPKAKPTKSTAASGESKE